MKNIIILSAMAAAMLVSPAAFAKGGSHNVKGHTTKNGVYVPHHHATNPDSTKSNN